MKSKMGFVAVATTLLLCTGARAFDVIGAIADKYRQPAVNRLLGPATSDEQPAPFGGRFQQFANGVIFWHPNADIGAHEVHGAILGLWTQLGRTAFGYPITDETDALDGRGRFNHFRPVQLPGKEERSIYWTNDTQAHSVIGAIRDKWAQWEWQQGKLGYPSSEEMQDGNGSQILISSTALSGGRPRLAQR